MQGGDLEVIAVLEVRAGVAAVRLPDTSGEDWSGASLPGGVQPGDRVSVMVNEGGLDVLLRLAGLRAERSALHKREGRSTAGCARPDAEGRQYANNGESR